MEPDKRNYDAIERIMTKEELDKFGRWGFDYRTPRKEKDYLREYNEEEGDS